MIGRADENDVDIFPVQYAPEILRQERLTLGDLLRARSEVSIVDVAESGRIGKDVAAALAARADNGGDDAVIRPRLSLRGEDTARNDVW